ncbi:HAD family hydrolase [Brachybacterium sp. J153]|uniref:HAD family hydrolase n=1 Tax=Brachybacterium sp. J153 TaxID=3116488 RepID=UPI002E79CB0F|nr:HAD-IA family hydrolase [Brachybacterium sp. J153]MEE1617246.1 HAD-IA family hydrolase [Brachybacterium sp. J153]
MPHDSLDVLRELVNTARIRVVVSDLDGVLRVFDPTLWAELDALTGTAGGSSYSAVLGHPYLDEVVRGRGTHARWRELAVERLVAAGSPTDLARFAVDRWAATPAAVDERVRSALLALRTVGIAVFVLTNGTDRVPEEVADLGLGDVVGDDDRFLLNTADLGAAKPDPEAFARARRRIEEVLGEQVPPERIALLDDSPRHVEGAAACGWHAVLHRPEDASRTGLRLP